MDDTDIVSRIMDKAATADRRALFAGLQAAVWALVDATYRGGEEADLARVERALDIGAPYGSSEHLASIEPT